jgi:hypothetical protein
MIWITLSLNGTTFNSPVILFNSLTCEFSSWTSTPKWLFILRNFNLIQFFLYRNVNKKNLSFSYGLKLHSCRVSIMETSFHNFVILEERIGAGDLLLMSSFENQHSNVSTETCVVQKWWLLFQPYNIKLFVILKH